MTDPNDPIFWIILFSSVVGTAFVLTAFLVKIPKLPDPHPWWVEIQCQRCGTIIRVPQDPRPGDDPAVLDGAALRTAAQEHPSGELYIVTREWPPSKV